MTPPAPTEASLDRTRAAVDVGRDPLVVFDLDGTRSRPASASPVRVRARLSTLPTTIT